MQGTSQRPNCFLKYYLHVGSAAYYNLPANAETAKLVVVSSEVLYVQGLVQTR
jgi:hypothetical protein